MAGGFSKQGTSIVHIAIFIVSLAAGSTTYTARTIKMKEEEESNGCQRVSLPHQAVSLTPLPVELDLDEGLQQLNSDYFIKGFIWGLTGEIRALVRKVRPQTLLEAYHHAQLEEASIKACKRKKQSQIGDYLGLGNTRANIMDEVAHSIPSPYLVDENGDFVTKDGEMSANKLRSPVLESSALWEWKQNQLYNGVSPMKTNSVVLASSHDYWWPRVKFKQNDASLNFKEPYKDCVLKERTVDVKAGNVYQEGSSCLDFHDLSCFYDLIFFISHGNGQKNITVNKAVTAWGWVLAGTFRLQNQ
ncbi:unnamed protein product [Linum tenue]|uniref:Uncharacterized protein n=1 Tax=Linum tenue TaxID=586396 RepID=A0AAV0R161_9ROSI|nr:unnamed protein product [Linum tenue]